MSKRVHELEPAEPASRSAEGRHTDRHCMRWVWGGLGGGVVWEGAGLISVQ